MMDGRFAKAMMAALLAGSGAAVPAPAGTDQIFVHGTVLGRLDRGDTPVLATSIEGAKVWSAL